MFDRRTGAMIVVSLLIGAPALVFADAERSHDYDLARPGDYQLTPAVASALQPPASPGIAPLGMVTDQQGWGDQWNGVDFPVRGSQQFAGNGITRATSGR